MMPFVRSQTPTRCGQHSVDMKALFLACMLLP